ncbi:MAG: cell division protein FtsZ [Dongiaceae bacterium]
MTLNLSMPTSPFETKPRITVIGVGGAGGNAVNNMIRSNLEGVEFVVCNTDAQALAQSLCDRRIQLGRNITQGLGAGARAEVGRAAAEEALEDIIEQLQGTNMVFITAGMGGGTGTGGAPVIARAAREHGILTVGVVTKPFHFEGLHRMRMAEAGIHELQQFVDTLIIIPNQNLFRVANERTTFADAFNMADEVLHSGVRGVTDLMVMPGLINLDFADIRSVMTEMGKAMMGTGEAEGDNRAVAAAEAAISNPLLDDVSMRGARGVLINITGGMDMTLFEVDEAANRIRDEVDPDANIIFGSTFSPGLDGRIRISVVATGIEAEAASVPRPALSLVGNKGRAAPLQAPLAAAPATPAAAAPAAQAPAAAEAPAEPAARRDDKAQAFGRPAEERPAAVEPSRAALLRAEPPLAGGLRPSATEPARPAQPERRRAPNLFARVTGAAWTRSSGPSERSEPTPAPLPAAATTPATTIPAKPASPAVAQSRLAGLDPQERGNATKNEEDLLDIPAFLRRQAN